MDYSIITTTVIEALWKTAPWRLETIESIEVKIEYGIPMYTVSQIN